jgi:hypothetical protein
LSALALAAGIWALPNSSALAQAQGNVGAGASGGVTGASGGGSASAGIGGGLMGGGMGGPGPTVPSGTGGLGPGYFGGWPGAGGLSSTNRYSADYGYSYGAPTYGAPSNYGAPGYGGPGLYGPTGYGGPDLYVPTGYGGPGSPPLYFGTTYSGPGYPRAGQGGYGLAYGFVPAYGGPAVDTSYTPVYGLGHHYPHSYFISQLSFVNWCTDIKGIANFDPPSMVFYSAPPAGAGPPPANATPAASGGNTTAQGR